MALIGSMAAGAAAEVGGVGEKLGFKAIEAEIQRARDERLNEYAAASQQRGFEHQTNERREGEKFRAGESAADRASREREGEANRGVQREGIAVQKSSQEETTRHNQAIEKITAAAEGRLAKGAELDNSIKTIALENARRVEALKKEFSGATPERQRAINEEVQLLTGKDNDNFLPVPLKDELGNITGYQVLDKKRGVWVNTGSSSGGKAPYPDGTELKGKDGNLYVVKNGQPVLKEGSKPARSAPTERAAPSESEPTPAAGAGVSYYGPLTPWSTVEKQVRAGDQAAIRYATNRIKKGPGIIGVEPPESLVEYLKQLNSNN